jgi:hypothetical protein
MIFMEPTTYERHERVERNVRSKVFDAPDMPGGVTGTFRPTAVWATWHSRNGVWSLTRFGVTGKRVLKSGELSKLGAAALYGSLDDPRVPEWVRRFVEVNAP